MDRIVIAKQFSIYPMGRIDEDGPNNGTRFFNEFLRTNLREGRKTEVVFDGLRACGSSFLDQAFHILPEAEGFNEKRFRELVSIEATGRTYQFYKNMAQDFTKKIAP